MRFAILALLSGCVCRPAVDEGIHDYEWFHTVYNTVQARVAQIASHLEALHASTDERERQRLLMEILAIRQSCRDLVADYNANSDKVTVGVFQGSSLPDHLDPLLCEAK